MQKLANTLRAALGMTAVVTLLSGCAIGMKVPVKDPVPSTQAYKKEGALAPMALAFQNEQSEADKAAIMTGVLPMQLLSQDKPFDGVSWVAAHTVSEMKARGLPVSLGGGGTSVGIKRLHIENYRANGFSPFITFTSVRADVLTAAGPQRVTAYVKRAKVPVWSFDEIIDPTYNDALSLLTKELAAKLNQQLFGQVVGTEQVNALVAAINADGTTRADAYLDVYQLGFSNNPAAVPELVKLTSHGSEYVRLAAISSLGILKASDQFGFLVKLYETKTGLWQDRAMALKAIGDLGTPESRDYLKKESGKLASQSDKESTWNKDIIALYL